MKTIKEKITGLKDFRMNGRRWLLAAMLLGDVVLVAAVSYAAEDAGMLKDTPASRPVFMTAFAVLLALLSVRAYEYAEPGRNKEYKSVWKAPFFAAALTLVIVVISYVYVGIWPFGDKSVVVGDMYSQYMPLMAYMRRILLGKGGSLLYSPSMGLGLTMLPTFTYYLASPWNLFLVFFPEKYLTEYFLFLIIAKSVCAAFTFTLCIQELTGRHDDSSVIGGVLYACSMYMVAYAWNVMWLDVILLMPLVILEFKRMMENGKRLRLIILLTLSLYTNFYISFMVYIFLALWFVAWCVGNGIKGKELALRFRDLFICMATAGMLTAVFTIPTWLCLRMTPAAADQSKGWTENLKLIEVWGRQLFGVSPTVINESNLNIACGVLTLIAVPLYAVTDSIPKRKRIANLSVWGFIVISFAVSELNLIWHGGHYPVGLPYRYAFIYIFMTLYMTCVLLGHISEITPRKIAVTAAALILYIFWIDTQNISEIGFDAIYGSFILVLLYMGALLLIANKKMTQMSLYPLLLLLVVGEMVCSEADTKTAIRDKGFYTTRSTYLLKPSHQLIGAAADKANEKDTSGNFFRSANSDRFTYMDGTLYGFNNETIFASTYYKAAQVTAGDLGMATGSNSQFEECFMPTLDSLLGVKYYFTSANIKDHQQLEYVDCASNVSDSINIYENKDALPLGFVGTGNLGTYGSTKYDPVMSQNNLYKAIMGNDNDVLLKDDIAPVDENLASVKEKKSGVSFTINGNGSTASEAVFRVEITNPGQIFVYADCGDATDITVHAGDASYTIDPDKACFCDIGNKESGDTLTVDIKAGASGVTGNLYAVTVNQDTFDKDVELIRSRGFTKCSFNGSKVSAQLNSDTDGILMTTIPYDKGWTVYVDGVKTDTFSVDMSLLAFNVTSGQHEIKMSYIPEGLKSGACISAITLVALVCYYMMLRKRKKQGK